MDLCLDVDFGTFPLTQNGLKCGKKGDLALVQAISGALP